MEIDFMAALNEEKIIEEEKAVLPRVLTALDLSAVKPDFKKYESEIDGMETGAQALVIQTDEDRVKASTIGGAAAKLTKALDSKRKQILEPMEDFKKSLNNFVAGFTDRLKTIAALTKQKEAAYLDLKEMERRKKEKLAQDAKERLQETINEEAKAAGIEPIKLPLPVVPPEPAKVRTETGTTSYEVKTWVGEIVDAVAVPRVYCVPSQSLINAAVREGVRWIEDVKIYEKTDIRYRT